MQGSGDEYGSNLMNLRAAKQWKSENPDWKPSEEGMARGGAADGKQGKEAVLMKALEIIHHMIRGR